MRFFAITGDNIKDALMLCSGVSKKATADTFLRLLRQRLFKDLEADHLQKMQFIEVGYFRYF